MKSGVIRELNPKELWHHPVLPIFVENSPEYKPEISTKLYLVPTLDNLIGESPDPDFQPQPSPLSELPECTNWVKRYVVGAV